MRKLHSFIALLLLLVFCFNSCGEYNPAIQRPGGNNTDTDTPGGGGDKETEGYTFTATLYYDGERFVPDEKINVQWTDGFAVYTAELNDEGQAEVHGLDGDYKVTLSGIPAGYIYNPNALVATNDKRNTRIELYKITKTTGAGDGPYSCIKLQKPGIFSATLDSATDVLYYQFTPLEAGVYSVEGWVDTTANQVNPKLDIYNGSSAWKQYAYTLDDGGAESYFTKNFKYEVKISKEGIGQAFTFAVKGTSKDNTYPITINFVVTLDGGFDSGRTAAPIVPMMDLPESGNHTYDSALYTFVGAEDIVNGNRIFDGTKYRYWSVEDGGDGYYHRFDINVYPETKGYGPIVYAYVSQPCRFVDEALTTIENRGNKALTVDGINYKLAIQGFADLIVDPPGDNGPYLCNSDCPCYVGVDADLIGPDGQPVLNSDGTVKQYKKKCIGGCRADCEKCNKDCRHLPDEMFDLIEEATKNEVGELTHTRDCPGCNGIKLSNGSTWHTTYYLPYEFCGYASYANSAGLVPVTQGLKEFLQAFSISQLYFFDGDGFVETNPEVPVDAGEDDQWLFACGWYKPNQ